MKKIHIQILTTLLLITLMLSACGQVSTAALSDSESVITDISQKSESPENTLSEKLHSQEGYTNSTSTTQEKLPVSKENDTASDIQQTTPQISDSIFSLTDIIQYDGQPYVIVNNNVPYFSEEDLTDQSYEFYSDLDELGRCGVAYANIGIDIMPTEERGEIGQIKPSGWHTVKYNDLIDGNYLYNRCHLIGYQLSGENANVQNLITGTRYLNVEGMLPFENMVADYIKETGNHVLYRVTPIFEEDNLLASGVLMEAESVEDKGEGVLFCVYAYNVQPGIIIDYATGESYLDSNMQNPEPASVPTPESTVEPAIEFTPTTTSTSEPSVESTEESIVSQETESQGTVYILNTNTKKFHYPYCSSVDQMKESNKQEYTGSRDDVISQGYVPCKRCNP